MIAFLKNTFRRPYHYLRHYVAPQGPNDFDHDTLPLVDRDVSLDEVIAKAQITGSLPYDLKEKLSFWRENGYVVLENVLPTQWLDNLWNEVEQTIENHEQYDMTALVYQFNNTKDAKLKDIPKDKLKSIGARINDYHNASIGAKKVMTHPNIVAFLRAVLDNDLTAFQSLIFKYSSQQSTHQDYPWVTSGIPSHLAAAWIPLEDVHPDSGPLFYYPGSHKLPKFHFGVTGILYKHGLSLFSPDQFGKYLDKICAKFGIQKKVLLIKKGDILIWHGALAHGGSRINTAEMTRKSFVCHYSTVQAQPKHRAEPKDVSPTSYYNGVAIYANPANLAQEDIISQGKDWTE